MGEGEGGEEDGLTRQSSRFPRILMHSCRALLRNDARTRMFLENYNSSADLAHQAIQNPRSRGEAV
jgi:hypothetical protein